MTDKLGCPTLRLLYFQIPVGSNTVPSTVILTPVCKRPVIDNYPTAPILNEDSPYNLQMQCGDHVLVPFTAVAPECLEDIPVDGACVSADTMLSTDFGAQFAVSDSPDEGDADKIHRIVSYIVKATCTYLAFNSAWSPAVRLGDEWRNYLEFDLGVVARVSRLTIGQPSTVGTDPVRHVTRATVLYSRVPGFVERTEVEQADLTETAGVITFDAPVEARFFRVVVLDASSDAPLDTTPMAVNG